MKKDRSLFWDNYKGILIFLVVFGHFIYSYANNLSESLAHDLYIIIYSFHMPAFVFCSGYFSKSERSRNKESIITLLLYYIVFNTIMLLFAHFYMGNNVKLLTPYFSYWYILSLIFWRLFIGEVDKIKGLLPLALILALVIGYEKEFSNFLSIRRTVGFFVFFAAGYLMDREKVENFIKKRKVWCLSGYFILLFIIPAIINLGGDNKLLKITGAVTMFNTYKQRTDILKRMLAMIIASTAIVSMFFIVPDKKLPLISKIGKNSLLIYLAHRFITIIFYKELFPYKTYTDRYLIFAFLATVLTCAVLGGDRLNGLVTKYFHRAAVEIADPLSKKGNLLKTIIWIGMIILVCAYAIS